MHAGDLLALMNLGNAVTCLLIPVLAHRAADQRKLAALAMLATAAGIAGAVFGPAGLAAGVHPAAGPWPGRDPWPGHLLHDGARA